MVSSDHRRRLAALEAHARALVAQANDRGYARLQQLLTAAELAALTAFWQRQRADPGTRPSEAEAAAVDRLQACCRTDPELQVIDRQFGPLQWAVHWGEAWQARY